jgi:hypothetical protein
MAAKKPPLALDAEVETADGDLYRWDPTSRLASNRPQGMSHSSQRGEGAGPASVQLTRQVMRDYPDLGLLDTIRFVGKNGEVAYEGRNHDFARTNDPIQQFAVNLTGWYSAMKDRRFSEIYLDRDITKWGDPPLTRQLQLLGGQVLGDGVTISAASSPNGTQALSFLYSALRKWLRGGELWYYGGGVDLGVLNFVFRGSGGDEAWVDIAALVADEYYSSAYATGDFNGTVGPVESGVAAGGPGMKYAVVSTWRNQGESELDPYNGVHRWEIPVVRGRNNSVPIQGAATIATYGIFVSDLMRDIVTRFTPLTYAGNPTTYPVGQAAWLETYPDDAAKGLNDFHLWEKGVYEDKKLFHRPADLTKADWIVRTDDPGVRFTPLQGDSIEGFANGVEVTFTDFSGVTHTLYPSDFAELRDSSETNPANRHGLQLWTPFTAPFPCNLAEALQMGRAYLAEYNRPKAPGTISIAGGYIRDAAGHWQQGWKPRSSETIALVDHPNDAPRLITQTSWDQDSKILQISVDNGYQLLPAFLARQANALEAAGLTR